MSAGGVAAESHIGVTVVPMSCQPPGDCRGYTAEKSPASPTAPAGTSVRGESRRGTSSACAGSAGTQYVNPGAKPPKAPITAARCAIR